MALISRCTLLCLAAFGLAVGSGCSHKAGIPNRAIAPAPKEIASSDSQCSLTVPPGWAADNELNASAEIQVSNRKDDLYAVVLTEAKADFEEMTKEKYSRITRKALMKTLKSAKPTGPKKMTVNGFPALQYQISGVMDGINVIYLHTTIEGTKNYYQVLVWTMKTKFEAAQPALEQVINSFRETETSPASKKSARG